MCYQLHIAAPCWVLASQRPYLPMGMKWNIWRLTCTAPCLPAVTLLCAWSCTYPVVHAQELVLKRTDVPPPALFALTRLQQLVALDVDLSHVSYHATEDLVSLVSLLFRRMSVLKTLKIGVAPSSLEAGMDACFKKLREQLGAWRIYDVKILRIVVLSE